MATQRYISTSFWTDKWVRSLDPSERYLYLYLLTNPETNIAGIYDITIDRIAFDTGYDERTLRPMLERFSAAGKAYYINDEWVVIPSWPRHQKIKERDNNRKGIDTILMELPEEIFVVLKGLGYQYKYLDELKRPLEAPSKPLARESNYINSDINSDSELNSELDSSGAAPSEPPSDQIEDTPFQEEPKPLSPMKDPVAQDWQERLVKITPPDAWKSPPQERAQLVKLAKLTRSLSTVTGLSPPEIVPEALSRYRELKETGKTDFWRGAPFVPSGIVARWNDLVEAMRVEAEEYSGVIF